MNIIILHGNHTDNLYKRLRKFIHVAKGRGIEIDRYSKDSKETLGEIASSKSLFKDNRLLIVDEFSKLNKKDIDWINNESTKYEGSVVIYSEKIIPKTTLNKLPSQKKEELYEIPKLIFTFLDSFYPENQKSCIRLFHEIIENEPVEFIFSLLSSRLKELYWVIADPSSIPYPSWRVQKLENQASKFDEKKIKYLINKLSDIDIKVKTSNTKLIPSIDLLILKDLE